MDGKTNRGISNIFRELPQNIQDYIQETLTLSSEQQDWINNMGGAFRVDYSLSAKYKGKEQRHVIIKKENGEINYLVKKGNKKILKATNKVKIINNLAKFFCREINKLKKIYGKK